MLKNYSKIKVNEDGNKYYLNDEEKYHRLDGPAFEYPDGSKFWHINGNNHRNIDPAFEYSDREKFWWFKGKRHRVGGYSLYQLCFIHGRRYTKEKYFNKVWEI